MLLLGRAALVAQRPVKLSRGRSVGLCVGRSVGLSSALWKKGGSDPDAVWHHRSNGSSHEARVLGFEDRSMGKGTFGANLGRAIVTNGDFTAYVCDSAATRPFSQISLGRLVSFSKKLCNRSARQSACLSLNRSRSTRKVFERFSYAHKSNSDRRVAVIWRLIAI